MEQQFDPTDRVLVKLSMRCMFHNRKNSTGENAFQPRGNYERTQTMYTEQTFLLLVRAGFRYTPKAKLPSLFCKLFTQGRLNKRNWNHLQNSRVSQETKACQIEQEISLSQYRWAMVIGHPYFFTCGWLKCSELRTFRKCKNVAAKISVFKKIMDFHET